MAEKDGSTATLSINLGAMPLPLYKCYDIVLLARNKYGPHFRPNQIARIVNCNHRTVTKRLNLLG